MVYMLNKLSNYFGTDGLLHILCSIVAMTFLGFFLPLWLTIVIVLLIGIGKELIYDKLMGKGTPSWKDLLADVIGIVIGCF